MSDSFDPYHNWLGIPRQEQPPDYYRLLGIVLFESDPDVIQNACDQRMSHLKAFATGPRAALSQRLLNEVSRAAVCLLNPSKKRTYDEKLRARRERSQPVHPATTNARRPVASEAVEDLRSVRGDRGARTTQVPIEVAAAPSVSSTIVRRRYVRRRKQSVVALTVQLLLFGLVGLAAVCFVLWLVYPTHPLISFFERTVRPNSATPTEPGPPAQPLTQPRQPGTAPSPQKQEAAPAQASPATAPGPAPAAEPTPQGPPDRDENAELFAAHPDATTQQPDAGPEDAEFGATPTMPTEPDSDPEVNDPRHRTFEVDINLANQESYWVIPDVADPREVEVRLDRIAGLRTDSELVPADGVIRAGQSVDVVFALYANLTLRLSLDTSDAAARLKIAPLLDTGTGRVIHFTKRWISQENNDARRLAVGFQQEYDAARNEMVTIQTWLSSPVLKPLELRNQKRQRLTVLANTLPVLEQKALAADQQANAMQRLAAFAEQLQRSAKLQFVVREVAAENELDSGTNAEPAEGLEGRG